MDAVLCAAKSIDATIKAFGGIEENTSMRIGRKPGSRTTKRGPCRFYEDYLCSRPTYGPKHFRRRFRIPMLLYRRLEDDLTRREPRLLQQFDGLGRPGHTTHQNLLAALRRLGSGRSYDDLDDQVRMSAESQRQYFLCFLWAVKAEYGPQFLNRRPSNDEWLQHNELYESTGLPGAIGSVDNMKLIS
eukprot:Plantae.Rhodophyta-Rhodochaete_pulchella.ctg76429.p1 GENE.Plantae.Rhodophyta-Rhodochaete_pulchella.ctg76429~~Plantae.Rhodophyta-Rhodochaete_pulchella.ctg76429.p1  ORF type:complete len:205 (-),score=18.87 Plantae.Rhodophyta-Rhodochaete_pulchella.ctg76429:69-629(-)